MRVPFNLPNMTLRILFAIDFARKLRPKSDFLDVFLGDKLLFLARINATLRDFK